MVHRKIIEPTLARLDKDRSAYFSEVTRRLDEDRRTETWGNYGRAFVKDPGVVRSMTATFIRQSIDLSLEKHGLGEIETGELSVHKLSWPYRDTDVTDPDEEPDAWSEALAKSEEWRRRNPGKDRRQSGHARIDDMAAEKLRDANAETKAKQEIVKDTLKGLKSTD